jgi:hypothetical protein
MTRLLKGSFQKAFLHVQLDGADCFTSEQSGVGSEAAQFAARSKAVGYKNEFNRLPARGVIDGFGAECSVGIGFVGTTLFEMQQIRDNGKPCG